MTTKLSQKDYLKKYLFSDKTKHKKKKKKTKDANSKRVKIIDDDIDVVNNEINDLDEILLTGEDAPQIVGVIDDRPAELKTVEDFRRSGKWKSVSQNLSQQSNVNDYQEFYRNKLSESFNLKVQNERNNEDNLNTNRGKIDTNNAKKIYKEKQNLNSSDDLSPKRSKNHNEDLSPKRRTHRDVSQDLSPKRSKGKTEIGKDISPKRRKPRRDCSEDISPKRLKGNRESSEDISPRRRKVHRGSSVDFSSKKLKRNQGFSEDLSPRRKTDRCHDEDLSPKRPKRPREDLGPRSSKGNRESSEDLSPRRRKSDRGHGKDLSPKRLMSDRDSNNSPTHRKHYKDDLNSERKRNTNEIMIKELGKSSHSQDRSRVSPSARKTLDGKKAGLQDAKTLKQELEKFRRQENELFDKISKDISGKDAEVAVRISSNKNRNKKLNPEEEKRKMKLEKEKQEIYDRWGKGLKQIEDYKSRVANEEHEMNKPLARYSDDADLDDLLKKQERDGDPMLAYIRKKNKGTSSNKELSVPIYQGSFPENRFNIRPGYRWDGVDRSNGYEKRWFDVQNKKKAIQEEAYRYSTEDM